MKTVKKYKLSRKFGAPLFEKCQTQKFTLSESRKSPRIPRRQSEYAKQLLEKQKLRIIYSLNEKHLKNYVKKALQAENHEQELINLLESRLDSVIYQLGLAKTRRMARQVVSHGHITLNGKKATVPSTHVKTTDIIKIREGSKQNSIFSDLKDLLTSRPGAKWVEWDSNKSEGKIKTAPSFEEGLVNLSVVFEYYSR